MFSRFFCFTFFVIFTLVMIGVFNVYADDDAYLEKMMTGKMYRGMWRLAPGIYRVDSSQVTQPGDSATLNLVTSEPYYDVSWYVKAPWETSERGTFMENVSGDGMSTSTSFSYTFPSGSMHTGDFLITAVIYRWSDMSKYGEETYTVTVE